jgi:nucleoside-diphosphate-sugar epimerase
VDYASLVIPNKTISGDRNMKTAFTDLRDIGPYVAKCITDTRTLNKYVFCYGELISKDEIFAKMEELSGEKIEREFVRLLPDFLLAFWTLL